MLPTAIVRSLRPPPLTAHDFTSTKFHSAEEKAWFANALLKFLADDCPKSAFTDRLYRLLHNSFGHIAHYDKNGFFQNFFLDPNGKVEFLEQTLQWPCYGQPDFTFCDVERIIQQRISTANLLTIESTRRKAEVEARERRQLEHLTAKYGTPTQPTRIPAPQQGSLFDLSA